MLNFNETKIYDMAIQRNATDILYQTGEKPVLRIAGKLYQVADGDIFNLMESTPEFGEYLNERQQADFVKNGSADFAFSYGNDYRFRGNLYRQNKGLSMSFRLIRNRILSFEELNLPPFFSEIAMNYQQGFFLIVGPTGQGKSTTLAAILNHINQHRQEHIITIEDPIEYIFQNDKSLIEQRELGTHVPSFHEALRSAMRENPNVIMIGEMRDQDTIEAAITMAETGHLVFATLHTNDAAQTIDRIIDAFPEHKQKQVRQQLASTLTGVISQRLVPGIDNSLIFAYEQLIVTDAVRNIIRTEKTEQIYNALQGSQDNGMVRLEKCLADLVKAKKITLENAMVFANNRDLIQVFMQYNS